MKKNRVLLLFIMAMPFAVAAQDFEDLLKGSAADAKYLASGYIAPAMKAFGYGMNNGWINTAKPHKIAGFDLTISANPVFIPSADKLFQVDNSKMSSLELVTDVDGKPVAPGGKGNIATVFGSDESKAQLRLKDDPTLQTFSSPNGINYGLLPVPTVHLGFGLPKGFDLKLRFVPTTKFGSGSSKGSVGLWGIGVMHDFKQWIPGIKQLPFDLSAFVGYTKMTASVGISQGGPDGKGEFGCSATTIQVIISKKLSVLTPYASVGYNMAKTTLDVKGKYDLNDNGNTSDPGETNPFALSVASTGPRVTGGIRLKFGPLAFHGDYTLAKYKSASVGFGINIR
jgi:hypothetical protein